MMVMLLLLLLLMMMLVMLLLLMMMMVMLLLLLLIVLLLLLAIVELSLGDIRCLCKSTQGRVIVTNWLDFELYTVRMHAPHKP